MKSGSQAEQAWYEFLAKQTERFGCPLVCRKANPNEDRFEGWDMKLSNPRTKKTLLIDVTRDLRNKRIDQWIVRDEVGVKSKVDLKGEVHICVVVDARSSAKRLFSYAEQVLA